MLSAGFAAETIEGAELRLDEAHDGHRWIRRDMADREFLWPGQRAAIKHIVSDILPVESPMARHLRLEIGGE